MMVADYGDRNRLPALLTGALLLLSVGACGPTVEVDGDEDGFNLSDGDCNDSDPATYPGAAEFCDGEDRNCDGAANCYLTTVSAGADHSCGLTAAGDLVCWGGNEEGQSEPPTGSV